MLIDSHSLNQPLSNSGTLSKFLRKKFGERFSESRAVCEHHCQNMTWLPKQRPDGVVFVESTEEVAEVVRLCSAHETPIIPFGAGSSLEGQVNAPFGGLCMNLSRMDEIITVHPEDMHAVVQPGVTRSKLNSYLRDTGLFFPIDPGADATLAGMAATRASGTNAVRYGTMRENVISLEMVLPSGKIVRTGTRAKKSAAGYDLTRLFVGSEGTLGIITEMTVKLYGTPQAVIGGVCPFSTVADACGVVISAIQSGIDVARVELLDQMAIRACNRYSNLKLDETPTLFVEFHGSQAHVEHEVNRFSEIVHEYRGGPFQWTDKETDRAALWKARHDAWWAIHSLYPGASGVSTDVCVPISKLADCICQTQEDIAVSGLNAVIIGHVGDGNFHSLVMLDMGNHEEVERAKEFVGRLNERAISMDGTCTGEHGVGQGKMAYMNLEHGASFEEMRTIKMALDPKNILNPGKLFYGAPE